jgi:hypothetical protein
MLKILAALVALVFVMVGLAASAHAYDLLRRIYGPNYQFADLAFVIGAAMMCFGAAHLCIRYAFNTSNGGRSPAARHDTNDAE